MAPDPPKYSSMDYIIKFDGLREDKHHKNCYLNLLNRIDDYPDATVLDPCLENHFQMLARPGPYFPRKSRELLPIQRPSVVDVWATGPSQLRGFPSFHVDFYGWYLRMMFDDWIPPIWEKTGITVLFSSAASIWI